MNTIVNKILNAGLSLRQVLIIYGDDIITCRSLTGLGEELKFRDGGEIIVDDSGNYISVYEAIADIYSLYELQGDCYRLI